MLHYRGKKNYNILLSDDFTFHLIGVWGGFKCSASGILSCKHLFVGLYKKSRSTYKKLGIPKHLNHL